MITSKNINKLTKLRQKSLRAANGSHHYGMSGTGRQPESKRRKARKRKHILHSSPLREKLCGSKISKVNGLAS
jgi:hypothetical protein